MGIRAWDQGSGAIIRSVTVPGFRADSSSGLEAKSES